MPETTKTARKRQANPLEIGFMLLLITLLTPYMLAYLLHEFYLRLMFHRIWASQGRFVLFVYSNSPNWKNYIESHVLPPIRDYAIVLNWSERSQWKGRLSWPVQAFRHWGGSKDFNPLAIVYCGPTMIRTIRFFQALRAFKHGDEASLRQAEAQLMELVTARAGRLARAKAR
jgi:hypothetical protein